MEITFVPLDITYAVIGNKAQIRIYGRTDKGIVCLVDDSFLPYFYAVPRKASEAHQLADKIAKLRIEQLERHGAVVKTEVCNVALHGRAMKAIKVYVTLPQDVPGIKSMVAYFDQIADVLEYDIPFVRRYIIDKEINMFVPMKVQCEPFEEADENSEQGQAQNAKYFRLIGIQKARPLSYKPRILAFDIETYSKFLDPDSPILMISLYGKDFKKVITWKRFDTEIEDVCFVKDEAELIEGFQDAIKEYCPDVIVGYFSDGFDLPFILHRAKENNICLTLGAAESKPRITRQRRSVKITGLVHFDLFKFISRALSSTLKTDAFSLGDVASELLGMKKKDVNLDSLPEAWDKNVGLEEYCLYNLHDAKLTYCLAEKLLPIAIELSKLTGLPLYDVGRTGFSNLVEWFIIKKAKRYGILAPNKPNEYEKQCRTARTFKGAFVFEPKPGLYENIAVFDFRSLYPTIIVSHNICPTTLRCACCKSNAIPGHDFWFCRLRKGFIPEVLKSLITERAKIKEELKKKDDAILEAKSWCFKVLANAFYGYMGFFNARWYCFECAQATTALGRHYIKKVINEAEKAGFNVIYSDTDSVFLVLGNKTREQAILFNNKINKTFPGLIELELEGFYRRGIFVPIKETEHGAKKKYALISDSGKIKVKGFEAVRRNWSPLARQLQEQVLKIVLQEKDVSKAFSLVKETIKKLRKKTIPNKQLIITTQLQKDPQSYVSTTPHVAIAQKLIDDGESIKAGSIIQYIVCEGKGAIKDKARLPSRVQQGEYDAEYYIKHQVLPAVERILEVIGHNKEELIGAAKQCLLDSFMKG